MPGSFSFTPGPGQVPLARSADTILVVRATGWDQTPPAWKYQLLPNVYPLSCDDAKEGPEPGAAYFRYVFDPINLDPQTYPYLTEQVFPLTAAGPYVLEQDDRICVFRPNDDGSTDLLFDGFVQLPQANLSRQGETVTFTALGAMIRLWDHVLGPAVQIDDPTFDNNRPSILQASGVPARFNPNGFPNKYEAEVNIVDTPAVIQMSAFFQKYTDSADIMPLDPNFWMLSDAAIYLVYAGLSTRISNNQTLVPDATFLNPPSPNTIKLVLQSMEPTGFWINFDDPTTFTYEPILAQDLDVTGQPWPVALWKLIEPHGFAYRFVLDQDSSGNPAWYMKFYRKDNDEAPKPVNYQDWGATFDPAQQGPDNIHLARSTHELANSWVIDTAPTEVEVSIILGRSWIVNASDLDAGNLHKWILGDANFDPDAYRLFTANETGLDTVADIAGGAASKALDLDDIFPKDAGGDLVYSHRWRPGKGPLFSKDAAGERYPYQLRISTDYNGPATPCVWDGMSGTWTRLVTGGQWELLHDKLGIRITCANAASWMIGGPTVSNLGSIWADGKVNIVQSFVSPTDKNPKFWLMLTVRIPSDRGLDVDAPQRPASPTKFEVQRRDDVRDRFVKQYISPNSFYGNPDEDTIIKDDTQLAQSHADQRRRAHELARFAGTITIPRIITSIEVGDKINEIQGRDISLNSVAVIGNGEGAVYPSVVSRQWNFDGAQSTTFHLSDRRADPARPNRPHRAPGNIANIYKAIRAQRHAPPAPAPAPTLPSPFEGSPGPVTFAP